MLITVLVKHFPLKW